MCFLFESVRVHLLFCALVPDAARTITHNDNCPEMLASVRRGPLAPPKDEESIEYLLMRKKRDAQRPAVEHFSLEHVLSYQRRVKAVKQWFMDRNVKTPLGRVRDWWDRTEAQMRAALHAHILVWFKLRPDPGNQVSEKGEKYSALPSLVKLQVIGPLHQCHHELGDVHDVDGVKEVDK